MPTRNRKFGLAGWVGAEAYPSLITRIKAQTQKCKSWLPEVALRPLHRLWLSMRLPSTTACTPQQLVLYPQIFTILVSFNGSVVLGRVQGGRWRNEATWRWQTLVQWREAWGATLANFSHFSFLFFSLGGAGDWTQRHAKWTLNNSHSPSLLLYAVGTASTSLPCANKYY